MRILTAIRGNKRKKGESWRTTNIVKSVELWTGQKKKEISPPFVKKKKKQ